MKDHRGLGTVRSVALAWLLAASAWTHATGTAVADNAVCPPATPTMGPPSPQPAPHFVDPATIDFLKLLPPPPAASTMFAEAELEVVRQVQAARTPDEEEWAKVVDADCVFNLAGILGQWFRRENLPATDAFFKDLGDDIRAVDRASKAPFQRPRPFIVDPALQPCVRRPASPSYPSGSALQAYLWADLLAEIFPEKRAELTARAQRAAWGRVVGGVHYPSDLTAGRLLVPAFLAEGRKSAAFRAALDRCRAELLAAAGRGSG
jgi:acid phosphatase (class A)